MALAGRGGLGGEPVVGWVGSRLWGGRGGGVDVLVSDFGSRLFFVALRLSWFPPCGWLVGFGIGRQGIASALLSLTSNYLPAFYVKHWQRGEKDCRTFIAKNTKKTKKKETKSVTCEDLHSNT